MTLNSRIEHFYQKGGCKGNAVLIFELIDWSDKLLSPSPRGRGDTTLLLPLPQGEGWGEGYNTQNKYLEIIFFKLTGQQW